MDQPQNDEEVVSEQEVLDDHKLKVMALIHHTGDLIGEPSQTKTGPENDLVAPQPNVPLPAPANDSLVDIHLDILNDLVQTIRRAFKHPDFVDAPLLTNYQDEVRNIEKSCKGSRKRYCRLRFSEITCEGHPILMEPYSI